MTKAHFWKTIEGKKLAFYMQVSGHAGYGKEGGGDIVCAACSALTQALMCAVRADPMCECTEWKIDAENGEARLKCLVSDELGAERAESMMAVAYSGFYMLAAEYAENVCVSGEMPENE